VALRTQANIQLKMKHREVASRNVIGMIEGRDPQRKGEYIVYTPHWDHLGRDPKLEGDQIYNGAVDNATGTAALIDLGRAFKEARPARSILFLAVTAEEQGLLGASYYANHPLYPLNKTVANLNMDAMNVWGRTRDLGVVGFGQSTLEDVLRTSAEAQGRVLIPEAEPEKGFYFRSDHFEFAKQGVPALYIDEGVEFVGKDPEYGRQKKAEYIARDYHKLSDEIKPGWDLSGLEEDIELLFRVGYAVSESRSWPEWKPGSEFKARRDEMLKSEPARQP
jgi:Zn-dependent M28 family amino/carboxypeptidase